MAVRFTSIEPGFSLNDPERGFRFHTIPDGVALEFTDWRNVPRVLTFTTVCFFSFDTFPPYPNLPEAVLLRLDESERIRALREAHVVGEAEVLTHFVISTNEDEWCEIVSATFEVAATD
jgi:hypothetical protein